MLDFMSRGMIGQHRGEYVMVMSRYDMTAEADWLQLMRGPDRGDGHVVPFSSSGGVLGGGVHAGRASAGAGGGGGEGRGVVCEVVRCVGMYRNVCISECCTCTCANGSVMGELRKILMRRSVSRMIFPGATFG